MPPNGKGRSNYKLIPQEARRIKGYGSVAHYDRIGLSWESEREGDRTSVVIELPDAISHESLMTLIAGLNDGSVADRWS